MVAVGLMVTLSPVPAGVPPHEPVNHCVSAPLPLLPPVTDKVVLPPTQIKIVPVAPVGAIDNVFTVPFTGKLWVGIPLEAQVMLPEGLPEADVVNLT